MRYFNALAIPHLVTKDRLDYVRSAIGSREVYSPASCSTFKDIYDNQTAVEKLLEHFQVNSLGSFGDSLVSSGKALDTLGFKTFKRVCLAFSV